MRGEASVPVRSATDIPEWIHKVKHDLLDTREENGVWHVIVRKAK
jgi:TusA-related sulfurtransferase